MYVDIYSQWIARGCGLGKNLESMEMIDKIASEKIPFDVLHYHPDNNKTILKILFERIKFQNEKSFDLSRSRPYKKK